MEDNCAVMGNTECENAHLTQLLGDVIKPKFDEKITFQLISFKATLHPESD